MILIFSERKKTRKIPQKKNCKLRRDKNFWNWSPDSAETVFDWSNFSTQDFATPLSQSPFAQRAATYQT